MRQILVTALAVPLLVATVGAVPPSGPVANALNEAFCSELNPTPVQACFEPLMDLGTVSVPFAFLDPSLGESEGVNANLSLVRLIIQEDAVEVPAVSVSFTDDFCAPYSELMIECEVLETIPVIVPGPDVDGLDPQFADFVIGGATVGTLTLKLDGDVLGVVPGYVDVYATSCSNPDIHVLDVDCDGYDNVEEIQAGSNPLYRYSTPDDQGQGFPLDWDADNWGTHTELNHANPNWFRSDPTQRCSTPLEPQGPDSPDPPNDWVPTDPPCE